MFTRNLSTYYYPTNEELEPLLIHIRRHGIITPIIIINEDNRVLDGVRRVHAAASLGIKEVKHSTITCSELEFYYYRIGMNLHRPCSDELISIISMEKDMTLEELAKEAGLSHDYIIKGLKLNKIEKHLETMPLCTAAFLMTLEGYKKGASKPFIERAKKEHFSEIEMDIRKKIKEIQNDRVNKRANREDKKAR